MTTHECHKTVLEPTGIPVSGIPSISDARFRNRNRFRNLREFLLESELELESEIYKMLESESRHTRNRASLPSIPLKFNLIK